MSWRALAVPALVLLAAAANGCGPGPRTDCPPGEPVEGSAAAGLPPVSAPGPGVRRPSIVMISLDTLGARHLGLYGYERDTSPNLDAWAAEATVFLNAYSTSASTAESHMSMFTSLYPSVHGIRNLIDKDRVRALDGEVLSFVQTLQEHGYATVGYHNGGNVDSVYGFDRGFDVYRRGKLSDAVVWLEENADQRPFFLFFHTYFVHDPYLPRPPGDARFTDPGYEGGIIHSRDQLLELTGESGWRAQHRTFWERVDESDPDDVAHLVALYDALVAQLDADLAALLDAIARHAPGAIVILLSDHGEEFGQHGKFRHQQVYGEVLHVPLIVRHPERGRGRRVEEAVSLIDLAPTVLALAGLPTSVQFQGRSLAGHLDATGPRRPIFAEYRKQRALIDGGWKLVERRGRKAELYDLAADPEEQHNVSRAGLLARVGSWLSDYRGLRPQLARLEGCNEVKRAELSATTRRVDLPDETRRQLEALGYLEP